MLLNYLSISDKRVTSARGVLWDVRDYFGHSRCHDISNESNSEANRILIFKWRNATQDRADFVMVEHTESCVRGGPHVRRRPVSVLLCALCPSRLPCLAKSVLFCAASPTSQYMLSLTEITCHSAEQGRVRCCFRPVSLVRTAMTVRVTKIISKGPEYPPRALVRKRPPRISAHRNSSVRNYYDRWQWRPPTWGRRVARMSGRR